MTILKLLKELKEASMELVKACLENGDYKGVTTSMALYLTIDLIEKVIEKNYVSEDKIGTEEEWDYWGE